MSYTPDQVSLVEGHVEYVEVHDNEAMEEWCGGKQVRQELVRFARFLSNAMRDIKFIHKEGCLLVHCPGDLFAMGRIGYGDFLVEGSGDYKFAVFSRNIKNTRYDDWRSQFHMKVSQNMEAALRTAKQYLRRYTQEEMFTAFQEHFIDAMGTQRTEVEESRNAAIRDVFGKDLSYHAHVVVNSPIMAEVHGLLSSGYEFMNPEVPKRLQDAITYDNEFKALKATAIPVKFVLLTDRYGVPSIAVSDVTFHARPRDNKGITNTEYYAVDGGIPPEIHGGLAVLQMCEAGKYIAGVGIKLAEGLYFVIPPTAEVE